MIAFPVGDENPCRIRPVAHWSIWALCLVGSLLTLHLGWASPWQVVPVVLNLTLLAILGDNVEERLGSAGYVSFALAAAAVGGGAAVVFHGGASGLAAAVHAVCAGAIGAYAVWFPGHEIKVVYLLPFGSSMDWSAGVASWPALVVLGVWGLASLVAAIVWPSASTVASIAAFLAGGVMAAVLQVRPQPRIRVEAKKVEGPVEETRVRRRQDAPPEPSTAAPPCHYLEVSAPRRASERVVVPSSAAEADLFAVVRLDEARIDLAEATARVAAATGELRAEAAMRIRRSRGVVARRLREGVARSLSESLARIGARCGVVPDGPAQEVPAAREAELMAVSEAGLRVSLRDGTQVEAPWPQVFLALGVGMRRARDVEEERPSTPAIEVFNAHPFLRMRARKGEASFLPAPIRALARELLRVRRGTPVNPGISVIAGGGRLGYLDFDREVDLDNYVWWIVQLLRNPAADAASFPHYLE